MVLWFCWPQLSTPSCLSRVLCSSIQTKAVLGALWRALVITNQSVTWMQKAGILLLLGDLPSHDHYSVEVSG